MKPSTPTQAVEEGIGEEQKGEKGEWALSYLYIYDLFICLTYTLFRYRGVGMQQIQDKRREGKNEEMTD